MAVGPHRGVPSVEVPAALQRLEGQAQAALAGPDAAIPTGARPATPQELHAVLTLAAILHGEWVRIHPFANGNGRVARLRMHWTAARYALPPFMRSSRARPAPPTPPPTP